MPIRTISNGGTGATHASPEKSLGRRQIGTIGTIVRVVLGVGFLGAGVLGGRLTTVGGHLQTGFSWWSFVFGFGVFPAVLLSWQGWRSRGHATRLVATGPAATVLNMAVFLALVFAPAYAQVLSFTSGAALLFYGASLLLAAVRGYAGCEVLAVSNWVLRRDDQIGCLVISPIDNLERGLAH